jgi:hypothetical protein
MAFPAIIPDRPTSLFQTRAAVKSPYLLQNVRRMFSQVTANSDQELLTTYGAQPIQPETQTAQGATTDKVSECFNY